MTGEWVSGTVVDRLIAEVGNREELLAHGIIDLDWLQFHPTAEKQFRALKEAAALPEEPLAGIAGPQPPKMDACRSKEELRALARQFAEDPTEANPFQTLLNISNKKH